MQWCTDGAARYASQGARLSRLWLTVLVRLSNRTDSGLDGFHAGSIRLLASKTEVAPESQRPAARASGQRPEPAASGQHCCAPISLLQRFQVTCSGVCRGPDSTRMREHSD